MDSLKLLIDQIKFHLKDYLSENKIEFNQSGKIKCLNPNHKDKNPSMSFVPETKDQLLHCFSCGASYNILHIAKLIDNKPNRGPGLLQNTIPWLCEKYGIPYNPEDISVSPEQIEISEYRELYESAAIVLKELATYEPCEKRNWKQKFCYENGIGTVNWDKFKKRLIQHGNYEEDYFITRDITPKIFNDDRLTFVVKDKFGRVCGFAARDLNWEKGNKTPKFINTAGYVPIYQKGKTLYGAHLLSTDNNESEQRVDVFEGYGDWITARQAGHKFCTAVCGTSLTSHHIETLKEMGYTHINLVFDGDVPGTEKMATYLETYSNIPGIRFTITILPFEESQPLDARDPDDFINQYGLMDFMAVKPTSAFDWKLKEFKDKGIHDTEIVRKLLPFIINETSPVERGNMCQVLAAAANVPEEDLRSEVRNRTNKTVRDIRDYAISKLRNASDATEIQQIFDSANSRIVAATSQKDHAVYHLSESANHFDKWLTDIRNPVSDTQGWKTGFPTLDDPVVLGGIPRKDSIITLAGPPNHGKSAILINLIKNILLQDNKNLTVLFWHLDDSRNVAWSKLMASMMAMPILDIKRPDRNILKSPELTKSWTDCCDFMKHQLNERNPRLIVKGHEIGNDFLSAERWIKEVQQKTGNNVILFVDAVNDMSTGDPGTDGNERLKFIKCYDWFQRTTEMLEYTVITVCHITKAGIAKGKGEIFDAAETGKILYSSKMIGMVYSELDYFSQGGRRNQTPKFWTDKTVIVDPNGPIKDNKQPIVELAIQKSKESSFKGSIFFRHKAEACWMEEIRGIELDNLLAYNDREIKNNVVNAINLANETPEFN